MKCAVVMPVGPGHEYLAEDALDSVTDAWREGRGPFSEIVPLRVDDTQGSLGRSRARNEGVSLAVQAGAEWVFFLDADDLMHPRCLVNAEPWLDEHDALWGATWELAPDESSSGPRDEQVAPITDIVSLVTTNPFLTVQMGHFVRTRVAAETPFDPALDCGEDWDYYLRVWARHRVRKIEAPLYVIRRGMHSIGPRSATGRQWNRAVHEQIERYCRRTDLRSEFELHGEQFAFRVHNPFDHIQRHHLTGQFFELEELEHLRATLPRDLRMLDVGANVGNHSVYLSRFLAPQSILLVEPNPGVSELLRMNLKANGVAQADLSLLGRAAGAASGRYRLTLRDPDNLGAARLEPAHDGPIAVEPLDALVDAPVGFAKIDVEGMELEVLQGMAGIVERHRPVLLVEAFNENFRALAEWLSAHAYRTSRVFEYRHARNVLAEPSG